MSEAAVWRHANTLHYKETQVSVLSHLFASSLSLPFWMYNTYSAFVATASLFFSFLHRTGLPSLILYVE